MTTKQEYFDKTIATLKTMKQRCMDPKNDHCVYEGANGEHCAVGMHLPPGPWMKCSGGADDLFIDYPEVKETLLIEDWPNAPYFWLSMQDIHDDAENWGGDNGTFGGRDAEVAVREFCREYDLKLPEGMSW